MRGYGFLIGYLTDRHLQPPTVQYRIGRPYLLSIPQCDRRGIRTYAGAMASGGGRDEKGGGAWRETGRLVFTFRKTRPIVEALAVMRALRGVCTLGAWHQG